MAPPDEEDSRIDVDDLSEGVVRVDRNHRIRGGNRWFWEMTGTGRKAEASGHLTDYVAPDDRDRCSRFLEGAFRGRTTAEIALMRPDGTTLPALLSACPRTAGAASDLVVTVTDLSAQKEAEEALRRRQTRLEERVRERTAELQELNAQLRALNTELLDEIQERNHIEEALSVSERKYRALVERIPAVTYVVRGHLRESTLYVSPQIERILGLTPLEWTADPDRWCAHIHPEDRKSVLDSWSAAVERRTGFSLEYRIVARDGDVLWFHDEASPLENDPDDAPLYQGVMIDVSVRERAQEALRESEERFRQLAEHIQAVFWIKDTGKPGLRYVSPGVEAIWGRPPEAFRDVFWTFLDWVHPDDRARLERAIRNYRGDGLFVEDYRILRPDGVERWVQSRAFPVRKADGRIYRYAGITEDVTERKKAEERLRRHGEELETRVRERTEQVRQLEYQRAAMEHLAAVGRVAARVAHEINNPLAGIKNAFLLVKDAIPSDHRYAGYIPRIQDEIDRIARIVRQMFELCPAEEGEAECGPADEVLRDVATLLESECARRAVRFETVLAPECARLRVPANSLRRVVHGLAQNAVDVSPREGTVRLEARVGPESRLEVEVRDPGPGIPEDRRPFIFEPFYTTKKAHGSSGLGLGLSICKALVEGLGGGIAYETTEGRGTVFRVTLPGKPAP